MYNIGKRSFYMKHNRSKTSCAHNI